MKVVTFGEIMLRLEPPGYERLRQARSFVALYGGAEANVAASLASFGVQAEYVTRLPANDLGDACLAYLQGYGVGTSRILRGGDRLGIYFIEKGAAQRGSKVVYDRAGSSFAAIEPGMVDWLDVCTGADWFHCTGVTPAVSQGAAEACLEAAKIAHGLGMTVSCDLNYRKNLWKWGKAPAAVMPGLVDQCDVLICNEEDAEKVFDIQAPGSDVQAARVQAGQYQYVAEQLAARFPNLRVIGITLRGSLSASHNTWSGVLWQRTKPRVPRTSPPEENQATFHIGQSYEIVPIVDRVGGGDAFAAGLIYGLRTAPDNPAYALRFAIAASCLKHSVPGDFSAVTVAEVEQLMQGDASGRVSR